MYCTCKRACCVYLSFQKLPTSKLLFFLPIENTFYWQSMLNPQSCGLNIRTKWTKSIHKLIFSPFCSNLPLSTCFCRWLTLHDQTGERKSFFKLVPVILRNFSSCPDLSGLLLYFAIDEKCLWVGDIYMWMVPTRHTRAHILMNNSLGLTCYSVSAP